MQIAGLQVLRTDGTSLGVGRSLARELAMVISGLPLGLGFAWAAWDPAERTWHDLLAGTIVKRRPPTTRIYRQAILGMPSAQPPKGTSWDPSTRSWQAK
jgi:uncharacterized RDD family membrane protein YckC